VRAANELREGQGDNAKDHPSGMGIEFVDLSAEDRAAIDAQLA